MKRALQTVFGVLLVSAGVFAFLKVPERGDAASLVLVFVGGFFISKSMVIEAFKAAKELLPWGKP